MSADTLLMTPLDALHAELGAKMMPFAGYSMPLHYPGGILAEHRQCRESAALFDVSHMGQIHVTGPGAAKALESVVPVDVVDLAPGRQRYAFFTNSNGGILDDLMITRQSDDELLLVVNAANKDADFRHLSTHIGHSCSVQPMPERALLALQGPQAAHALGTLNLSVKQLVFMSGGMFALANTKLGLDPVDCIVTRSGYTGEDGFEISVPAHAAIPLARALLALPQVKPAGLGARDTLRLEAGLCLHGRDIDPDTTPVEAGLSWAIQKVRRPGGARAGHYPGAATIERQLAVGPMSRRVGLVALERVPVREGAKITDGRNHPLGHVTSGTIGPTIDKPIAMAYLAANHAQNSHEVYAHVRDRRVPMRVLPMPFVPHRYHRG